MQSLKPKLLQLVEAVWRRMGGYLRCHKCGGWAKFTGYDPGWPVIGYDEWTCEKCGVVTNY